MIKFSSLDDSSSCIKFPISPVLEQTHQFFSGFQNPVSQRITNGSHVCNKCFPLNTFLAHQRTSRYVTAQHAIISESFSSLPNKRRGGEERGSASTPKSVYTRPVCTVYTLSRWTIFVRSGDARSASVLPPPSRQLPFSMRAMPRAQVSRDIFLFFSPGESSWDRFWFSQRLFFIFVSKR